MASIGRFLQPAAGSFFAVEVKNSDKVRSDDLRGLRAFVSDYPECQPILLYRGIERLDVGGMPCWPVDAFLTQLRPGSDAVPASGWS